MRKLFFAAFCVLSLFAVISNAQETKPVKPTITKEKLVTKHATGTFEVKVTPLAAEDNVGDPKIGRLSLDKQFSGGITAKSLGQMLGYQSETPGTGGYVAIEQVTGTLDGKKGGFALQHIGTMGGGKFELNVSVVPGSGTGELAGIAGKMTINLDGSKHSYDLEYTIDPPK